MPMFNGTGPMGQGPMSGRGMGPCGRGYGPRGYGYGRGMGRRWLPFFQQTEPNDEEKAKYLEEEIKMLKEEMKSMQEELEKYKK